QVMEVLADSARALLVLGRLEEPGHSRHEAFRVLEDEEREDRDEDDHPRADDPLEDGRGDALAVAEDLAGVALDRRLDRADRLRPPAEARKGAAEGTAGAPVLREPRKALGHRAGLGRQAGPEDTARGEDGREQHEVDRGDGTRPGP